MKTILMTMALLSTPVWATNPPDPQPIKATPVKIINKNSVVGVNKQTQKQSQTTSSTSSSNSTATSGDSSSSSSVGDQITEVVVSPDIDNVAKIDTGAVVNDLSNGMSNIIDNRQTYIHHDRIQHSVPTLGVNTVGEASRSSNAFVVTGSYDEMTGSSVNAGVVFSFGGGASIAEKSMEHEAHRINMNNIYAEERHKQETAKFCADLQNSGVPVTPDNKVLWDKCQNYLVVVAAPKVIKVPTVPKGWIKKPYVNKKGYAIIDGETFIKRSMAYAPNWEDPCNKSKEK